MALPMNLIMTKRSWIPHIHSRKFDDLRPEFPFDLFFLAALMNTWPPKTAAESRWMKVFYGGSTGTLKNMRKWGIVTLLLWKIKVLMHRPNYSEACSPSFTWERMGIEWCWWSSPWFRQEWPGFLHVWQGPVAVSYSKKTDHLQHSSTLPVSALKHTPKLRHLPTFWKTRQASWNCRGHVSFPATKYQEKGWNWSNKKCKTLQRPFATCSNGHFLKWGYASHHPFSWDDPF